MIKKLLDLQQAYYDSIDLGTPLFANIIITKESASFVCWNGKATIKHNISLKNLGAHISEFAMLMGSSMYLNNGNNSKKLPTDKEIMNATFEFDNEIFQWWFMARNICNKYLHNQEWALAYVLLWSQDCGLQIQRIESKKDIDCLLPQD